MSRKNILLLKIVFFVRKLLPSKTAARKILVVSTTGLGDTIWASGVLTSLKERFPHKEIDLLTTTLGTELLTSHIALSKIYTLPSRGWIYIFPLLKSLIKVRYETIFLFHSSQRWVFLLCSLLKPKFLVSTRSYNKGLDHLFTHLTQPAPVHEIERRYLMVESLLGPLKRHPLDLPIYPSFTTSVQNKLQQIGSIEFESYILLQPLAKDPFKQWPLSCFEQLIDFLSLEYNLPIMINSSPQELPFLERLRSKGVFFLAEHFCFREILEVIRHAKILISNDTGPLHIALSYRVPTLALFSPTDPIICGPYLTSNAKCIIKPPTCFPCIKQKCKEAVCMRQIKIEEVIQEVKSLIASLDQKEMDLEEDSLAEIF